MARVQFTLNLIITSAIEAILIEKLLKDMEKNKHIDFFCFFCRPVRAKFVFILWL